MVNNSIDVRVCYKKTGRAIYISQLDLLRAMQRAIKRSGIPVWYTMGYNPHAYLAFPVSLPLGTRGEREFMDFAVNYEVSAEEICEKLNAVLPEGLEVISASSPIHHQTEIGWSIYNVCAVSEIGGEKLLEKFREFLQSEKIEVEKRSKKKGINIVDIKPHINLLEAFADDSSITASLRLPSGNDFNLAPQLIFDAFQKLFEVEIDNISITRTKILLKNGEDFA